MRARHGRADHGPLTPATTHEATTTGRRYGGRDALAAGIAAAVAPEDAVLPLALWRAQELAGKHPATLAAIKRQQYAAPLALLQPRLTPVPA